MVMIPELFSWWYTTGWAALVHRVVERVDRMLETFSVGLLAKTLFAPFHQISAGNVQGPFEAQMRALGDRTFSRVFGAFIRSVFIIIGSAGALLIGLFGLIQLVIWPLVPVLPVAGLILTLIGWSF